MFSDNRKKNSDYEFDVEYAVWASRDDDGATKCAVDDPLATDSR